MAWKHGVIKKWEDSDWQDERRPNQSSLGARDKRREKRADEKEDSLVSLTNDLEERLAGNTKPEDKSDGKEELNQMKKSLCTCLQAIKQIQDKGVLGKDSSWQEPVGELQQCLPGEPDQ